MSCQELVVSSFVKYSAPGQLGFLSVTITPDGISFCGKKYLNVHRFCNAKLKYCTQNIIIWCMRNYAITVEYSCLNLWNLTNCDHYLNSQRLWFHCVSHIVYYSLWHHRIQSVIYNINDTNEPLVTPKNINLATSSCLCVLKALSI